MMRRLTSAALVAALCLASVARAQLVGGGGSSGPTPNGASGQGLTSNGSGGFGAPFTLGSFATLSALPANSVTLGMMAQAPGNTLRGNFTGATANVQDFAVPACAAPNALGWTAGTGLVCYTPYTAPAALTQNSQSGATYTIVAGDSGNQILHPSSATGTINVTLNTATLAAGAKTDFINDCSAGVATLTPGAGVTFEWAPTGGSGARTVAACGEVTFSAITSSKIMITGAGVS